MAATLAGRKRKRNEGLGEDVNLNTRIGGKIHHETKLVHKACKKARLFEIQKVVQRLKNDRKKKAEDTIISNYEIQLSCLKTVNDDVIGNSAFRSKILKDHLLRDNEAVLSFVKKLEPHLPGPIEPTSTLAKIQSRLRSSKILSAQVAASVESLKVLVNPAHKVQKGKNTRGNEDIQHVSQKSNGEDSSRPSAFFEDDRESPPPMADDSGWESGTVGMGDGIEAGSESDYDRSQSSPHLLSDFEEQAETEPDESVNGSGHEKNSVVRTRGGHNRLNKGKNADPSITESTFLPSLSVGFIQGSDDSDFNETAELKAADMPKKNRRGQRARRAIWEKKYGRHANHKKREDEERAAALAQKTARGQIPSASHAQRRTISRQEGAGKEPNNVRGAKSRSEDDKPLHPSWEAKRKQKDKERGTILPGQGKKIKF